MIDSDEPENLNAFPVFEKNMFVDDVKQGMTLREYFAGQALQGIDISTNKPHSFIDWIKYLFGMSYTGCNTRTSDVVDKVYEIADAMLSEREDGGHIE